MPFSTICNCFSFITIENLIDRGWGWLVQLQFVKAALISSIKLILRIIEMNSEKLIAKLLVKACIQYLLMSE